MNTQEITIPVPWGHISAKLWGENIGVRVLCVHGLQDNCSSFDCLIPLLNPDKTYLCVDLPNHGYSSRAPLGTRWIQENYVVSLKQVVDYIQWTKFHVIGHSMGGQILNLFTALYPQHVITQIILDSSGPIPVEPKEIVLFTRQVIDKLLQKEQEIQETDVIPGYTYDEAFHHIKHRFYGELTDEAARTLLKRSIKYGLSGKYNFNADQRLKVPYHQMLSPEQHLNVVRNIKCPTLLIIAKESAEYFKTIYKAVFDIFKLNPFVEIIEVEGNHDVHINNPKKISEIINKFLSRNSCKL
ncbi:serine hydrolase-like protein isoform X1 [Daktulosphaira vitifoliae]|uniref:serine hydrolase-like protein isoform X1 n=1 Tax=Daktulosphaira vitifoliae TaxID=58002 RepID=UPI0021A99926|nr:serine hydrolase-like protein isoform X1 [Daktulosphaira vitifoliae]